ncbi:DUF1156 domain-containing protein [Promicromonospora sp. MEB111]|uniref:DUF1156 domain-containing protein n=1 Tax=Promicromonospora sp. MEB111 TaxID=3040301 RepID=UPI00254CDB9C|nr:DUF1156 domain-containing protein [Promicromonospora sp. MEB111]
MTTLPPRRKLIEVSLPLEEINAESAREKSIRYGHPSTLHLWWARRPLAAARAVLFAQLVDDPSSDESLSPEEQKAERERLHGIIRRLVKWENINDERLYAEARAEILRSTGGKPPAILDPFAGGGTIPLEAQRLGLEAHASDLNPVAVLINKALIEIPPKFAGRPPVFPGAAESRLGDWPRATGLAEDVRRYGAWMRDRAEERIGHLYPKATLPSGEKATVIAWIWARTVTCPNPACGIEMPLVRSWWLAKKKGKETYVVPEVVDDASVPAGRRVVFRIGHDVEQAPTAANGGTVDGSGAVCVSCDTAVELKAIRAEGKAVRLGAQLMATVAEGKRQRIYVEPTEEHVKAAEILVPDAIPAGSLPAAALGFRVQAYGLTRWADLFTSRQLTALTTFSDLVSEVREQVLKDAATAGLMSGARLPDGGTGVEAYADAVGTYLGIAASNTTDDHSSLVSWRSSHGTGATRSTFARQALPMVWDYAEANPLSGTAGDFENTIPGIAATLDRITPATHGQVHQLDAAARDFSGVLVATDPPYYDNIGYSDLSDFFYVWLRRSLRQIHPNLFGTMLVPKVEELVADPYRHGGKDQAEKFFETGFEHVFGRARQSATPDYPITVFYAFKQKELESEGVASTGWSTFLDGMIREGWTITATWPVRSERAGRMRDVGSNALASSIVLALRPRPETAAAADRTGFLVALREELEEALPRIREGAIAPADLRQTVLGPGMAVYSRYSRVLEADGTRMPVKTALALINATFDAIETEQDADVDPDTRFCLDWYKSYGWATRPYGDAESLAVPLGLSVDGIARGGILTSGGGKVALIKPLDLDPSWDPARDDRNSVWEATCHLARAYATEGREAAARLMAVLTGEATGASSSGRIKVSLDDAQRLALRLYELMETKDAATAGLFNGLGGAWAEVAATAQNLPKPAVQDGFDFDTVAEETF